MRAAELLRSAGSVWSLADVLWVTQHALLSLGRFDEAAEMAVEADPLAERIAAIAPQGGGSSCQL